MSTLKDKLLKLSEEVVDLSDKLDELEFEEESKDRFVIFRRLREIGDELLSHKEKAEGDDLAYANYALGSVASLLGYNERAEEAYDKALEHWPDHVGILNEAYHLLIEAGKHKKAKTYIQRSMKHGGETPDILYNYASLTAHMGDIDEARIILINALAKFPHDRGCRALLEQLESGEQKN
ncbi:MAG: tetratricopeptide repeat protein [Balneolia bacterium]|nr:tetratricopeptide repeat protein [Balneolia bacterium]